MALEYRHEFKYVVSQTQAACLRNRIRPFMELDAHTGDRMNYRIRSLYFDDYRNTCYYENENGTSPREKFRIRIYDGNDNIIHLELKRKDRGKTRKESCSLSREQCDLLLNGRLKWEDVAVAGDRAAVLRKFYIWQETRRLEPKVIVEYEREPYVYRNGNVRVTFDTDIRSSSDREGFFNETIPARPVMPAGLLLMEVKYDEFLPDAIYRALQTGELQVSTFSKYYLCRKYNMGGINNYGI